MKTAMKEATEGAANGVTGAAVGADVEIKYYYDNKAKVQQPPAMIEYEATTDGDTVAKNVSDNDQGTTTGDTATDDDEKGMPIGEDGHALKDMILPPSTQGTHDITFTVAVVGQQEATSATIPKEEFDRSKEASKYPTTLDPNSVRKVGISC